MKPLLRWTAGSISILGAHILATAVKNMRKLYPEFDLVICYNNLLPEVLEFIQKLEVPLFEQTHTPDMEYEPYKACWKLYPPRIRIDAHEIVMDNDVVLAKRCKEIDQFLTMDSVLIYEGIYGCHGKYKVPNSYKINSGIFGLPPNFDFAKKIKKIQKQDKVRAWESWFDDQGCVGACLGDYHTRLMIPQKSIPCMGSDEFCKFNKQLTGFHFCGANRLKFHEVWEEYYRSNLWINL